MRSKLLFSLLTLTLLAVAGCRQSDGPVPVPDGDDPNRIVDLSRNLLNIAGGDPQGPEDLAKDLRVFVEENPGAQPAVAELANRSAAAVRGVMLSEAAARELADELWRTMRALELSEAQVEARVGEVRTTLTAAGIPNDRIEPVAAQVAEVQRVVRTRQRRWYEWR
jgi:hypothetical protein